MNNRGNEELEDKFHVGLKLLLQTNKSYERLEMSLVGWIKRDIIIATVPYLLEANKLTSEDHCVIRFLKDGVAYGFHTHMVTSLYSPVPLIFLQYPEHINSLALRKSQRVKTSIPAKMMGIRRDGDIISSNAIIADLSETGCLLELPSAELSEIGPDKNFYLTFTILDESIELDCTVRNIRKRGGHYLLGVEFKHSPKSCEESMQNHQGMLDVYQNSISTLIGSL